LTKKLLGHISGDFFITNSSGHSASVLRVSLSPFENFAVQMDQDRHKFLLFFVRFFPLLTLKKMAQVFGSLDRL
jgi:hypothetical protein